MDAPEIILRFLLAAALGALIGLERQVGRVDSDTDFAGLRTFALYAIWGAGATLLGQEVGQAAFAVVAAGFVGLLVIEYWFLASNGNRGTTTEAASFAAFVIGVLVWLEHEVPALALAVGVAILLQSKVWIHGVVSRFTDEDLRALLRFGVLTAVILPLVPDRNMGPFDAINPFEIWLMVVFVAGIGLAGYIALRLLGPRGLAPTGLVGGLVSSTAVTLGFARMSRRSPEVTNSLAAGILGASGLMYARVLVEAFVVEPDLGRTLVVPLGMLFVGVVGTALVVWWRSTRHDTVDPDLNVRNPVTITSALQFGALYGAVVFIAKALIDNVSQASLTAVGAVSGINDVDAITLATANFVRDGTVPVATGAGAVLAAVAVNTLVKAGLAFALGSRALGLRVAAVLVPAAAGSGVAWLLV
ncbi:MAG TPA: MgtC/SapB family protein [Acidimicrobiia bacterium]|nr:MgtC/SapB family protein [Acidimicrobiia bacterium]